MMKTHTFFALTVILVTSYAHAVTDYYITDLGSPAQSSRAYGINESGQVVGLNSYSDGSQAGFIFENGIMTELGTFASNTNNLGNSNALDINDSGQIAGYAYTGSTTHAFLTINGTMQSLGTLGASSSGSSVNEAGHVVGDSWDSWGGSGSLHAFYHDGTIMQDIHSFDGPFSRSIAYSINESDQIVGATTHALSESVHDYHAFMYEDGVMIDLGTLGGSHSSANAINDLGQIVGYSYDSNEQRHPFLYENGEMTKLPVGWGYGKDINNQGQILIDTGGMAYLYEDENLYTLINLLETNPGWSRLTSASAINELGQIVGAGEINGEFHAFLMTPVPEPASFIFLTAGAMMLRKRKR